MSPHGSCQEGLEARIFWAALWVLFLVFVGELGGGRAWPSGPSGLKMGVACDIGKLVADQTRKNIIRQVCRAKHFDKFRLVWFSDECPLDNLDLCRLDDVACRNIEIHGPVIITEKFKIKVLSMGTCINDV